MTTARRTTLLAAAGLLAALATAAAARAAPAYPIHPVPLRMLCEQSDLIVIATVMGQRPDPAEPDRWTTLADLAVLETLKGPEAPGALSIPYSAGLVCPAPPSYPVGETLIVFLRRHGEADRLVTQSLSYGTKSMSAADRAVYAQRIREWVRISREQDSETRLARTTEWLVQMAEDPVTRWEAVFDLDDHKRADEEAWGRRTLSPDYWSHTSAAQRQRLLDLVLEPGVADYSWWLLMRLFEDDPDERLLPAAVARLRAIEGRPSSVAWSAMHFAADRLGDGHLKAWLVEQYGTDVAVALPTFLAQVGDLGGALR